MYKTIFNPYFVSPCCEISTGALIAASLASSALSAGASAAGAGMTSHQFRESMDFSKESRDLAYENQWKMFNAANEYESPAAQRKRLEEAGLNPYLMLQGGNAGTANPTSVNSPSSPNSPSYGNLLGGIENLPNAIGIALDNEGKQIENDYKRESILTNLSLNRAQLQKLHADTSLIDSQIERQLIENKFADAREGAINENMQSHTQLLRQQADLASVQSALGRFDLDYLKPHEVERISAEIDKLIMEGKTGYQLAHAAMMNARTLSGQLGLERDKWKYLGEAMLDEIDSRAERNYYESQPGFKAGGIHFNLQDLLPTPNYRRSQHSGGLR